MKHLLMIAVAALGGCASTSTVMDREPVEVRHSAQSAEAVVFCLQNKTGVAPADLDGAEVILYKGVYGGLIASYSVRPEATGSVIEIRRGAALRAPKWEECYG